MPYLSIAQAALDRWRSATRQMETCERESPAWHEASAAAELAKAEYQQAIEDAIAAHRPVPIPFDEATDADEPKTDMGAEGQDGEVYGG